MRENKLKMFQPESTKHALRRAVVAGLAGTLLLMLAMFAAPTPASARVSVGVFVGFGPPALPYYTQPPCPAPGYIWTPGYWAWDPAYGYYWVPGTWVPAPFIGAMWTPGYWGYDDDDDGYRWNPGYWGYSVGYYGGIDYGFGYTGYGYYGGYWNHNHFYYNRDVNRIEGRDFDHVYYRRVNHYYRDRRVSYNGGPGGIHIRPTRQQLAAERGRRSGPVSQQLRQRRFARRDPSQWARRNHGRPGIAATRRPGAFRGRDVIRAERAGAPYRAPVERRNRVRDFSRSAPQRGNNDRGFRSFGSSRNGQPYRGRENRAPVQRANHDGGRYRNHQQRSFNRGQDRQQQMHRFERPPSQRGQEQRAYRNNSPRNYQRTQRQERQQQMRRFERRSAPQQRGNFSRQQAHNGGHGHGDNGHGGDHGHGRGGRH